MQSAQAPRIQLRIQRPPSISTGTPATPRPTARIISSPGPKPVAPTSPTTSREKAKSNLLSRGAEYARGLIPGALERWVPSGLVTIAGRMTAKAKEIAVEAIKGTKTYERVQDKIVGVSRFLSGVNKQTADRKFAQLGKLNEEISSREESLRGRQARLGRTQEEIDVSVRNALRGLYDKRRALQEKVDKYDRKTEAHGKRVEGIENDRKTRIEKATAKLRSSYESVDARMKMIGPKISSLENQRARLSIEIDNLSVAIDNIGVGKKVFRGDADQLFILRMKLRSQEKDLGRKVSDLMTQADLLGAEKTALEVKLGISEPSSSVTQPAANDNPISSGSQVSLPVTGQQNFAGWDTNIRGGSTPEITWGTPVATPRSESGRTEFLGQEFVNRQVSDWNGNLKSWGLSGLKGNPGNIVDKDFTNLSFDAKKINIAQLQAVFNSKIMELVQAGIVTANSEAFAKMSKFAQEIKLNNK